MVVVVREQGWRMDVGVVLGGGNSTNDDELCGMIILWVIVVCFRTTSSTSYLLRAGESVKISRNATPTRHDSSFVPHPSSSINLRLPSYGEEGCSTICTYSTLRLYRARQNPPLPPR